MAKPETNREYWFDTTALTSAPRRKKPLETIKSVLPGMQLSDAQQEALVAFTQANDLDYTSWIVMDRRTEPMTSAVLDETCMTVACGPEPHLMEIGNHGWRFWKHESDGSASRRGYIAIRHGLGLPRVYLDSRTPGAATVLGAASAVVEVAGAFNFDSGDVHLSGAQALKRRARELDVPAALGYQVYVDVREQKTKAKFGRKARAEAELAATDAAAQVARAAELVDGAAALLFAELSASFDIEITDNWILAYSNFGELSTLDPDIWAWAFGSASRLFDVLEAWGVDTAGVRDQAWYTSDNVARPTDTDGALQKLMPARYSRVGKFLYGNPDA